jgi:hypothetical protein
MATWQPNFSTAFFFMGFAVLCSASTRAKATLDAQITINVRDFGAKGDGSDATPAIGLALQRIVSHGGVLILPKGTYEVSKRSTLPPNTRVRCEDGAVIAAAPAILWRGGVNIAFGATSGSNFEVSGCHFIYPYGNPNYGGGAAHILEFVGVAHVLIHDNVFDGGGDAVAEIGTTDTWEESNRATNASNACFDHWGGFTGAHTNKNYCTTLATAGPGVGGIQFTGIDTNGAPADSVGFEAKDNLIYVNNGNAPQCIEINGSQLGGADNNGSVIGNRCIVTGGNRAWGILVTGYSSHGEIADNVLEDNGGDYSAVAIFSPAKDWNVHGNMAINWSSGRQGAFKSTAQTGKLTDNRIYSSCADVPAPMRLRCTKP